MKTNNIYQKLADHLSHLAMGYPVREDLVDILKEIFTQKEATVACAIPANVIPLSPVSIETIQQNSALSKNELQAAIDGLVQKNLLFVGKTELGH